MISVDDKLHMILACLEQREKWYTEAREMVQGKIKWRNGYDFPRFTKEEFKMMEWDAAALELRNTIDMIKGYYKEERCDIINKCIYSSS